jgi:quercetin dioxygenase-like cupin family protein
MDLDYLKIPAPVDAPAVSSSMASALLAYSGIAVKMILDERHGAHLGNMFMVDYQPDVVLHPHDHPVEEAFYMLEGEVVYIADGEEYTLGVGDVAYAGVGCIHAFENRSGRKTRWLETRAPLPPVHHSYRFNRDWDFLADRLAVPAAASEQGEP